MNIDKAVLQKEVMYKTSRSGGKGGQNVNKVSSKVELLFSINSSTLFDDDQKLLLSEKLQTRFNKDDYLQIICDEERSQYLNKQKAIERLIVLLTKALHVPKIRKPSKVSKAAKTARLNEKRAQAEKKKDRKVDFND
jgi:ribosome-associated protein